MSPRRASQIGWSLLSAATILWLLTRTTASGSTMQIVFRAMAVACAVTAQPLVFRELSARQRLQSIPFVASLNTLLVATALLAVAWYLRLHTAHRLANYRGHPLANWLVDSGRALAKLEASLGQLVLTAGAFTAFGVYRAARRTRWAEDSTVYSASRWDALPPLAAALLGILVAGLIAWLPAYWRESAACIAIAGAVVWVSDR